MAHGLEAQRHRVVEAGYDIRAAQTGRQQDRQVLVMKFPGAVEHQNLVTGARVNFSILALVD